MGAGWDPPMSMCQLDPPSFPLTPASPSWGLRPPPTWVPVTGVLRRSGSYFGPFPGTGCFLGNHRAEKVKLPGQGGHRHAGYFQHHRHRHGEGRRSRGSSIMAGTDGQQEGWTLSWGWHGWARACPPPGTAAHPARLWEALASCWRKCPVPSQPGPGWDQILVPSRGRCRRHVTAVGRGNVGGPGTCLGCPPVPVPGGGGKRVKVWHWLLAAPLFSWPWRSCLPPPPPPGAEPSSWPCARTGCWRLPGAQRGGPAWPGRGAQPHGGGVLAPLPGNTSTSLQGDTGGICPYNCLGGLRSSGAPS